MYYIVYQTTNIVNGKLYIGCHKTTDIKDDYIGSGTVLQQAIKKYGRENFIRQTIAIFDHPEDAFRLETEIVNEEFVSREDTYNIKLGGHGGWDHVNGQMTEDQMNRRIKGYRQTMTKDLYEKRSGKTKQTWEQKDKEEHKRRVQQGVSRRDEKTRIVNYQQTMKNRDPELEKIRRQKISDAGAKMWELTSPDGEVFTIKSLRKFCVERGLNLHAMYNSASGHEQFKNPGWKCRRL